MDVQFYREGRFGNLVVFAAVYEQYLLGKHFYNEGKNEGTSWVLPDYKNRYTSTLEEWKNDVLTYGLQTITE